MEAQTKNMLAFIQGTEPVPLEQAKEFADWIVQVCTQSYLFSNMTKIESGKQG
jgi:hypothetical protein